MIVHMSHILFDTILQRSDLVPEFETFERDCLCYITAGSYALTGFRFSPPNFTICTNETQQHTKSCIRTMFTGKVLSGAMIPALLEACKLNFAHPASSEAAHDMILKEFTVGGQVIGFLGLGILGRIYCEVGLGFAFD